MSRTDLELGVWKTSKHNLQVFRTLPQHLRRPLQMGNISRNHFYIAHGFLIHEYTYNQNNFYAVKSFSNVHKPAICTWHTPVTVWLLSVS